ncbi:MAG: hypothetical protein KKA60_02025 [Proteobacteria bacterium]|nr:hypothetical protein [Pseudomonadota bacterium]
MVPDYDPRLLAVREELSRLTLAWARDKALDADKAKTLRRRAASLNHARYFANIPLYRRICERAGVTEAEPKFATLVADLMAPDDIFKSYPQRLLDEGDFSAMNRWVSEVSTLDLPEEAGAHATLDDWVESLAGRGAHLVFSSGTSGAMSFVPRDALTWDAFTRMPFLYVPFVLADRGVLPGWKAFLARGLARFLSPERLLDAFFKVGLRDFDGFFCNFSGGNQGIQLVGQKIGAMCGKAHFLYDTRMSATAVRAIVRGPATENDARLMEEFLATTVHDKEANYERLIREMRDSARRGRKCILFGTPYLLLEICERVAAGGALKLPKGSNVVFGGGWKSFTGERIPEAELLAVLSETFGIEPMAVCEGYSMTEIQALMLKCPHGLYHVPPHLEVVLLDEGLNAMDETSTTGILGVLDPFAGSYPGFLVTGDSVRMASGPCACGRPGLAIAQVERSPGREVKGCGGIMAKVNA